MITDVQNFFDRFLANTAIEEYREYSDSTFVHELIIKQENIINMMANQVMTARANAGITSSSVTEVTEIIRTKVWRKVYSHANIRKEFKKEYKAHFGNTRGVTVGAGVGGSRKVTFVAGKYATKRRTQKGGETTLIIAAMIQLWVQAWSLMKRELGKRYKDGPSMDRGRYVGEHKNTIIKEKFTTPDHVGLRAHGEVGAPGFQTTIASMSLAEGGVSGEGFDRELDQLDTEFRNTWGDGSGESGADWLMDRVREEVFWPIRRTYHLGDAQRFRRGSGLQRV